MPSTPSRLEPPDCHFLLAAQGWLELGCPADARAELERITTDLQGHPDVLDVRWEICAKEQQWDRALILSRALVGLRPDNAEAWVRQSYALHELGRTEEAWNSLLAVTARFPTVSVIPYNLACYACQMQRLEEARAWLRQAMKVGTANEIKTMALKDKDLMALWAEIPAM